MKRRELLMAAAALPLAAIPSLAAPAELPYVVYDVDDAWTRYDEVAPRDHRRGGPWFNFQAWCATELYEMKLQNPGKTVVSLINSHYVTAMSNAGMVDHSDVVLYVSTIPGLYTVLKDRTGKLPLGGVTNWPLTL